MKCSCRRVSLVGWR